MKQPIKVPIDFDSVMDVMGQINKGIYGINPYQKVEDIEFEADLNYNYEREEKHKEEQKQG